MTRAEIERLRKAYIDFCLQLNGSLAISFNFNRPVALITGQERIRKFFDRVCAECELTHSPNDPAGRALKALAFAEHVTSNIHWAGIVSAPKHVADHIVHSGGDIWCALSPSGQLYVERIRKKPAWSSYITKELGILGRLDGVLVY